MATPTSKAWPSTPDEDAWQGQEISWRILRGAPPDGDGHADAQPLAIPLRFIKTCAGRLYALRKALRGAWHGLQDPSVGWLIDWLLAAALARENVLLLGRPGVAKSQIATRFFELLGLQPPRVDSGAFQVMPQTVEEAWQQWQGRSKAARREQKYFHYLLSRFTQQEELFGPIEIGLLRQGVLVRVNFGLLTGPGVRAAFLDECFKASSAILNTLLTLSQEHTYFNWGGMQPADLVLLIGASNEMPGGFAAGATATGSTTEDFQTLYAFVDRFPLRLEIPMATAHAAGPIEDTDLGRAFAAAMGREARLFCRGRLFDAPPDRCACINDLLLLGRACYQHELPPDPHAAEPSEAGPVDEGGDNEAAQALFPAAAVNTFRTAFLAIAADLQGENTEAGLNQITWTISPRKLKALYKIALAHALVTDDAFLTDPDTRIVGSLGRAQANVFKLIWDSPVAKPELEERVRELIEDHF